MSSIELLKTFIESEFKDYNVIPSLANANDYHLLNVLFGDIGQQSYLSKVVSGTKKAELTNVGPLSDKTKQGIHVKELIEKAKEVKICKYDPTYCSTKANLELGLKKMSSSASHGKSTHSEAALSLGEITKKRIRYENIAELLKKLRSFDDDFIKLGKKHHMLIIYDVLYAENLAVEQASLTKSTTDVGIATRKPLSDVNQNVSQKKTLASDNCGSFSRGKETQQVAALSRPKEMGLFPIAFKCGKIRLICHKGGKKSLKLANMDKFYQPFDATDCHFGIPTCNEPSLENSQ